MNVLSTASARIGRLIQRLYSEAHSATRRRAIFPGSAEYWETRYAAGGNSGPGSSGKLAEFKAQTINAFVSEHSIESVIEFGCGDGTQLQLARYPQYLGFDVSETAIARCTELFQHDSRKIFKLMSEYSGENADLGLSLDVLYHLVEDSAFKQYLGTLFAACTRYVMIYSSDFDGDPWHEQPHVRHRTFTKYVREAQPEWKLIKRIPNKYPHRGDCNKGSYADLFVYWKRLRSPSRRAF